MLKKVPSQISLGVGCYSSKRFDDKLKIKNGDFKIAGFKIYLSNNKICGIGIIYQNKANGRKIIFTDTSQNQKYSALYEFKIPSNDYIQVIFGYCDDDQLNQLGIITYSGKQEIFGIDKGTKFNYMFMGYTFSGCSGIFRQGSIESLNFQVLKLPKDYVFHNLSPLFDILYPNILEENTQNREQSDQNTLNLSELSDQSVENASEIIDYQSTNKEQISQSNEIKKIEYSEFDFQQVNVERRPQQQQFSYGPNYNRNPQRNGFDPSLRQIGTGIMIGEMIVKLILRH
ncbi:unnamed protein product [Paramecium pentaurelia]|uniref:Jacalin-type lectin domain-containing protein n=1 Tax=Paramecium pentaurelia TaxID=43138 RepID=A0A8S1SAU8_9CILI|nr:unnamed protein product [Paramecium pentaurelia]